MKITNLKKIKKIILFIIVGLILSCIGSVWLSYHWLVVSHFTVENSKVSEAFRIVLISDLHDRHLGENNINLLEKIEVQSPDIIIVDGDMLNGDSESDNNVLRLVQNLSTIAPVYYSFGNHEYYFMEARHDDLKNRIEEAGATVLNHQIIDVEVNGNQIRLGGLYEYGFVTSMQSDDENQEAISYLEKFVCTDRYLIMCAHRPESFYCWNWADNWGIDLVLSGHLHGGQVIIPGIGGLYSGLEGFFPKYDYGQYKLGDSDMIITRGLGSNNKALPRFNNPPEIAVVDVIPAE